MRFVTKLIIGLSTLPVMAAIPKKANPFREGERLVYAKLVEAYRTNKLNEVIRQRKILEKNYPSSIHLDNAYYLSGMLQFQSDNIGEAVKSFNYVTDRFKGSNKRPGALFALAVAYQRLNLPKLASNVFNQVIKEYPGSPESQRAWMHLRLEKQERRF